MNDDPVFLKAVENLRSSDSQLYDEGYHQLQGAFLAVHLDSIIALMREETDPEIRGRFIELLGDSKKESVTPILAEELRHSSDAVRRWALHALDCIDSLRAREIAQTHVVRYPEDTP